MDPQESNSERTLAEPETLKALKAIRFTCFSFLLVISYFNIRSCRALWDARTVFADILDGRALPLVSRLVFQADVALLALSVAIPLTAIAALFTKNLPRGFYLLGALGLLSVCEVVLVCEAISRPLFLLLDSLGQVDAP